MFTTWIRLNFLTDAMNIHNIISEVRPDYIVNFAAQSHVKVSHDMETYTFQTNTLGILNILQSVRTLGLNCKIYHASTSEMYGNQTDGDINSPMVPVSIYGISKVAAQQICNMYRDAYGMFIVSSILFNHEGTRRGDAFVTQKIAKYVRELRDNGYYQPLEVGNLNARRDWGDARDYVNAVYLMLMSDKPQNYVIATGETHTVREFAELAFREIGIDLLWKGQGVNETAIDKEGRVLIKVNPYFYRDIDIHCLIGDASKAKRELNWIPSITFTELVKNMVN